MPKNNVWLPIVASIGVGAATYYSLSKNGHTIGQTLQKVIPFVNNMSQTNDSNNNPLGTHGMS